MHPMSCYLEVLEVYNNFHMSSICLKAQDISVAEIRQRKCPVHTEESKILNCVQVRTCRRHCEGVGVVLPNTALVTD